MYYDLRDEYARKYNLTPLIQTEDFLLDIEVTVREKIKPLEPGYGIIPDLVRSLVYSKSCDIALSRNSMFNSHPGSDTSNIAPVDIQFSILTMPCDCPINYSCCENIVNGDINYVVAFPHDAELLRKQNIKTIYDIDEKFGHPDSLIKLEDSVLSMLGSRDPSISKKFTHLYSQKSEIWKKCSQDIATPLANIYRHNRR